MAITRPAPTITGTKITTPTKAAGITSPAPKVTTKPSTATTALANKSPATGLWKVAEDFLGFAEKKVTDGIKKAWNSFTYWESKPSQAITVELGKLAGIPEAQQLDPFKVLTGRQKTDFGGQKFVQAGLDALADLTNSPNLKSSLFAKIPAWIVGASIDIVTDPFMYIGVGESSKAGEVMKEGERLGVMSKEGLKALKGIIGEDLTKISVEVLDAGKAKIADRFLAGETKLIDQGGLKFMGKTLVPGETFKNAFTKIKDSKIFNFVSDSRPVQEAKNLFNTLFNPRYVGGNIRAAVPEDFYNAYNDLFVKNTFSKIEGAQKSIDFLGKMTVDEQEQFFKLANEGLGGMSGKELTGKTLKQLQKMAPDIPEKVLSTYSKYLNEWRPVLQAEAEKLGLKTQLDNYIRNNYPDLEDWKQKYISSGRPIKEYTPGSFKERLTDEEWYRGFLKAKGMKPAEIEQMVIENAKEIPTLAKYIKDSYGLSKDPYLSLAKEYADLNVKKNVSTFISDTVENYGKKISVDQVNEYKRMGYGIYYPESFGRARVAPGGILTTKGVEVYTFENPAISNYLNKFSTDVAKSPALQTLNKLSQRIVNVYFFAPQSVTCHAMHNVMFNTWLSGGIEAFDNITKGISDVIKETPMYERALKAGALRPEGLPGTIKEIVDAELNRTGEKTLSKVLNLINPVSQNHIMNRVFWGSDSALRMNLFRNAIDMGQTDKEAASFVRQFTGNYRNLTESEKDVFRLVYPYYSWFKTNIKANFATWVTNPDRQLIPIKVLNAINEAASGKPLWENESGMAWKVNTGKKDEKGKYIYVNPAYAGTVIPQTVQNPTSLLYRMLSGPVPEIVSTLATGKNPYELITNQQSVIEAMPGATFTDRLKKSLAYFVPYEQQRALKSGNLDWVNILTGWDRTNPAWRNVLDVILQANTAGVTPSKVIEAIQTKQKFEYQKAKIKQQLKTK